MHTHMSLFEGDVNAFYDPSNEFGLSKVAQQFVAGLLHHAPEMTAITNQLVNSYKRMVVGDEAPVYVSWARNNRSALVRVPLTKASKESSKADRVPRPGLCRQSVSGLLGAAGRGPSGRGEGLRATRRGHR